MDDFRARTPRPPVADFAQSGRGGVHLAFIERGPAGRFEAAESRLDRSETLRRHEIAMFGYGTIGEIGRRIFNFFDKGAAHRGYRRRAGQRFVFGASMRLDASALVKSG